MAGPTHLAALLLLLPPPSILEPLSTLCLHPNQTKSNQEAEKIHNALSKTEDRDRKALSVFNVVKFPNTICTSSTSGRNGTCYTTSECLAKSGIISGSCASSFGVCCVFEATCGWSSIAENNTYFTSMAVIKGFNCKFKICKSQSNVCLLRLDFETFVLNPPSTLDTGHVKGTNTKNGDYTVGLACHVDTFSVSAPGSSAMPTICGTNSGEHMYVPATDSCNTLSADIGSTSTSTSSAFTIKISQIPCSSPVLPPPGCLQYFYGSSSAASEAYTYQGESGTLQAGALPYKACVRTERNYLYFKGHADMEGYYLL